MLRSHVLENDGRAFTSNNNVLSQAQTEHGKIWTPYGMPLCCRIHAWEAHHVKSQGVSSRHPSKMDVSAVSVLHLYHVPAAPGTSHTWNEQKPIIETHTEDEH